MSSLSSYHGWYIDVAMLLYSRSNIGGATGRRARAMTD